MENVTKTKERGERRRPLKPIESFKVRNATFPLASSASVVPTPLPMSESDNKSRLGRRTKTRFLGSAVNNNGHLSDQDNNNNNNLVPYESSPSVDLCNNINICSSDDCDCGRLMMMSLCNENTRLFNDGDFFASYDDNQRRTVVYDNSNIYSMMV